MGEIYTAKESVNPTKETPKSSGKKSSNIAFKDSVSKNKAPTFDVDESAVDIDIAKYNMKTNDSPKNPVKKQSDESLRDEGNTKRSSDPQTKNKSNEEIAGEETEDIKLVYHEDSTSDAAKKKAKTAPLKTNVAPIKSNRAPRRVQLITLSSPRELKKQ